MGILQVAVALLPDAELSNRLATVALAAHAASQGRLRWPRLPAHLSLKQPFAVESLATVDRAIDRVAGELAPLRVTLGAIEVQPPSPASPEAVVWVGVDAGASLLELERRLAADLSLAASDAAASFVSEAYRFHVTLGFLPTASLGADSALPSLAGTSATFAEIGLFVYDGLPVDKRPSAGWQCMLYARRSLGGPSGEGRSPIDRSDVLGANDASAPSSAFRRP